MRLTRLALTHSGKITGDYSRVVGYGAWMAHDADQARFGPEHRKKLLEVAVRALLSTARKGKAPEIDLATFPAPLQTIAPAFVTLNLESRLRGCIGSLAPYQPLARDVLVNAVKAGFKDPRFKPVTEDEIQQAEIEIAVLSHPAPMIFADEANLRSQLRPGEDGLILQDGNRRGTFLPKVWDSLDSPEAFLNGLKVKAGLARDHWSDSILISRYITESFRARMQPG